MNLIESRDTFLLLVCGHRLEDIDRLGDRFVVFHRRFGLPTVVRDGFRLFALVPKDIALLHCGQGRVTVRNLTTFRSSLHTDLVTGVV